MHDKKYKDQDSVISQFYYTFNIKKNDTEITFGIHQEDGSWIGAHLRDPLDVGIVILKDKKDDYSLHEYFTPSKDRDYFFKSKFRKGKYHLVPITSGVLMMRRPGIKMKIVSTNIQQPYEFSRLSPYLDSTLSDIFRKIDLFSNQGLEAEEINRFGVLIKNEYFKSILQKDLNQDNFDEMNCTQAGITEYGFKKVMIKQVSST